MKPGRGACAAALLALMLVAGTVPAARAATAEDLYKSALEARRVNDFDRAAQLLARARALAPKDADILLLLGQIQGFQQRYDLALDTLGQAQALAPDYADVRLAIARIRSYQGRYAEAAAEADAVLARDPGNAEALALKGRLALYQNRLDEAESAYRAARDAAPNLADPHVGLGDVAAARGQLDSAAAEYDLAEAREPGNADIAERRRRLAAGSTIDHPWRLDLSGGYSVYDGVARAPWREGGVSIGYRFSPATAVFGGVSFHSRFGEFSEQFEAGIFQRLADDIEGTLTATLAPGSEFLPRWSLAGGVTASIRAGDRQGFLGRTALTGDVRYQAYDGFDVLTLTPGFQQHLFAERLWLTFQLPFSRDRHGDWQVGWLVRGDWQATDRLRGFAGYSRALDTEISTTIETRTVFGGLGVDLDDQVGLTLTGEGEEQIDGPTRYGVTLGLTTRF
ncbi:YaiO family outer membrane beta-barrel protein [Inquilinus sp. Marseille-Q2685]|uniref:YaiO family outer membrane beta-barrel protein n=1 Tax=Inquilinus sp. Marseille-Q2685 TaxID=2866581 RepID=UPI001CE44076|nr:YaiO family outer membrane beta-barrel protein [Inquilinus sp. Marseille-Q2685]